MITITDLRKEYKKTGNAPVKVLDIGKVIIADGEILGISGVSGSGKTTFLHILTGLLLPTSGDVLIDQTYINRLPENKRDAYRANHIGYIFQSFNLIPYLTARENILLSMWLGKNVTKAQRKAKCDELLEQVGLAERADHLPGQMSGGEQQRVCIARAVANNPPIIVADEPTANLDSQTKLQVMELLKSICEKNNTTLIVSSHDKEILQGLPKVIRLDSSGSEVE